MSMPNDANGDQASPLLRPGEQVLWSGRPDPRRLFTGSDAFLVPFSLLWGGFAIFWETTAVTSGAPIFMAVFGLAFVAIGLYFIAGRFVVKRYQKSRTRYVITNQRGLILDGRGSTHETLLQHQPLSIRRSRNGGHASVTVGQTTGNPFAGGLSSYANTGMDVFARGSAPFAFYDVAKPEAMLAALEKTRVGGPQDATP